MLTERQRKQYQREAEEVNKLVNLSRQRPYGCKCPTLAKKLLGDGCEECNPERERGR